jgi:hypothetical protein
MRVSPFTRCVGEGKTATTIQLNASLWQPTISPTDPVGAFIFDLQSPSVTDCAVTDMRINGSAGSIQLSMGSSNYSGILCSLRDEIARVSLFDVWGYGLWISDTKAAYARVIDCEADRGLSAAGNAGNDCIGGGGVRVKIVRFYWMPGLQKNSALDFTTPGGTAFVERSVDIIDCINESPKDVVLEGCVQSTIRGNRFYGNSLDVKSDSAYSIATHPAVTNPADILVTDNVFVGVQSSPTSPYVGGSCLVTLDGGIYCPTKGMMGKPLNNGGRIAILGNTFINSAGSDPSKAGSAIRWAGDDASNSDGGSIISGNRIINPNANGLTSTISVPGGCGSNIKMGDDLGCGIAILASYGLTIGRNTINDTSTSQQMQYAMQLFSSDLQSNATTQRIIVTENVCGSAFSVGNGKLGTFYYNTSPTDALPAPVIHGNTNQQTGYDATASGQVPNGDPWPRAGGYPYDAEVYVTGGSLSSNIIVDGSDTGRKEGSFYLSAGSHITISWSNAPGGTPTVKVFRIAR